MDSLRVCRINHINQGISIGEIVTPVLSQRLLASDVPYIQLEFIVSQIFDVESLGGRDGRDILFGIMYTSLERALRIVVLPALSRPSTKILSYYFLFLRRLRKIPMSPPPWVVMLLIIRLLHNLLWYSSNLVFKQ